MSDNNKSNRGGSEADLAAVVVAVTQRLIAATRNFASVVEMVPPQTFPVNPFAKSIELYQQEEHPITEEIKAAIQNTGGDNQNIVEFIRLVVKNPNRPLKHVRLIGNLTRSILEAFVVLPPIVDYFPDICNFCGAMADFLKDDVLTTPSHAKALFASVKHHLQYSELDEADEDELAETLQQLCPPLMTFFPGYMELLKELLKELREEPDAKSAMPAASLCPMLREFLNQPIQEKFLFAYVDVGAKDKGQTISFAQKALVTSVTDNGRLAWFVSQSFEFAEQQGNKLEMDSWAALRAGRVQAEPFSPHRIWVEGIPDDIPVLDGYRIVIFHVGAYQRG